ncbi:MAG: hypothetical protein ISR58_02840 [Anaerolineales bacterium]|nr:hypothetical protein [Chloroflexota bacterium]MBL6980107.1 hypothetical protein [Anaerolineales bacterium]
MRITILLIAILFLTGCTVSDPLPVLTETPFSKIRPDDFQVEYYWETGALPPPYFYSYTITIGPGALGEIIFVADYKDEGPPIWVEKIAISDAELDDLYVRIFDMSLVEESWQQTDDIPDGGSANKLSVTAYGQDFSIPSYVADEEQAQAARVLFEYIEGLVSQEIWEKLNTLHDDYVREHEED